jgi:acyl-homoserine lactone acylase PvdQ
LEPKKAGPTDRREKFAELASKRVNRATHAIKTIGNLSNRSNYTWTEQDVKKIVRELRKAVKEVEDRFLGDKGPGHGDFFIRP